MIKLDHAPYVREWVGLVKTLIQLMIRDKDTKAEFPGLGIVVFNRKRKTLTFNLEEIETSTKQVVKNYPI